MATTKLHIEGGTARPEAIKHYLDLIDQREFDSIDAVMDAAFHQYGFPDPSTYNIDVVNVKGMAGTLSRLGLVKDDNRQQLTELGKALVDVLVNDEQLFFELFHFVFSTAYQRDPLPNRSISWSYYQISSELRQRAPAEFNEIKQEVVEAVREAAQNADDGFDNPGSLSEKSLNNYRKYSEQLEPAVFHNGTFELRSFPSKELVLATIDHLYRTDTVVTTQYGGPLELSDSVIEAISTICLVEEDAVTEVVEHTASMDARLSISSDYAIRVRLNDPVNINDLA